MTNDVVHKRFTLRYPEKLHLRIKADAEKYGISIGAMIKIILSERYQNKK